MRSLGRLVSFSPTSPIEGKLDLQLRGEGGWTTVAAEQPESFQWSIEGQVASPDISVFGVSLGLVEHDLSFDTDRLLFEQRVPFAADGVRNTNVYVERLAAEYQVNEQSIELSLISGKIFGGEVEGVAEVPRDEQGVLTTSLTWREIVPRINLGKYLPGEVELALRTSGEIGWQVPIGRIEEPAAHEGTLRVVADSITLNGEEVGELAVALEAKDNVCTLQSRACTSDPARFLSRCLAHLLQRDCAVRRYNHKLSVATR